MLKKYINKFGQTYVYCTKESFISDLCSHLQELKKTCKTGACFHQIMKLENKEVNEEWYFTIRIKEDFTISSCIYKNCKTNKTCKYFGEELKKSHNDTGYNKCRNITEFRQFLKYEVANPT